MHTSPCFLPGQQTRVVHALRLLRGLSQVCLCPQQSALQSLRPPLTGPTQDPRPRTLSVRHADAPWRATCELLCRRKWRDFL